MRDKLCHSLLGLLCQKHHRLGGLDNKPWFLTVLEDGKPKVKALAGTMSVCGPTSWGTAAVFSLCPHVAEGMREPSGVSFIRRKSHQWGLHPHGLVTPKVAPSCYRHRGHEVSTEAFWEGTHSLWQASLNLFSQLIISPTSFEKWVFLHFVFLENFSPERTLKRSERVQRQPSSSWLNHSPQPGWIRSKTGESQISRQRDLALKSA